MSKLDTFFSIEKIEYPMLSCIFLGVLLKAIEISLKITIHEIFFWIVMLIAFVAGNLYKMKKIEEKTNDNT